MRRIFVLCLLVLSCIALGILVYRAKSSPGGQSASPAESEAVATLAVGAEVRWQPAYVADPLVVSVRVWSPRERQELYRQALKFEESAVQTASAFVPPKIANDWVSSVALGLFKIDQAGAHIPVLPPAGWERYRIRPEAGSPSLADLGLASHSEVWIVSPDAARLTVGRYVLTVAWTAGTVAARSRTGDGDIKGKEVLFDVKSADSELERADHLGRLAYCEYRARDYERARKHAREAIVLDKGNLLPERTETWLILARSSIALQDFESARETLAELLAKLPPSEGSDVTLIAKQMLDSLQSRENAPFPSGSDRAKSLVR